MTLRITPFPEPRAVPTDPEPERKVRGLSAALPTSSGGGGETTPDDPGIPSIRQRLSRLGTGSPPRTSHKTTEPFPPVEPPPPKTPAPPEAAATPGEDPSPAPAPEKAPESPFSAAPADHEDAAADLREALAPFVEEAVEAALHGPRGSLQTYLEPMLRQTVRRAIAEQLESARLFATPNFLDRLRWHLQALFSSRTYEEIVFERTHRYQVEELYLFSRDLRRLLSYASHDPAQHSSPRRVRPTVRVLRARLADLRGKDEHAFDLPLGRLGLVREGKHTLLVAVLRGRSNSLIRTDLDYLQFQIEERYGKQLRDPENVFMHTLQPLLEGGLLIQAPAAER